MREHFFQTLLQTKQELKFICALPAPHMTHDQYLAFLYGFVDVVVARGKVYVGTYISLYIFSVTQSFMMIISGAKWSVYIIFS